MPEINNGWAEWSKYVLKELERLNKSYEDMNKEIGRIRTDIATLKVQASIWGGVAGCVPVAIMIAVKLVNQ